MISPQIDHKDILIIETLRCLPGMNGARILETIGKAGSFDDILIGTPSIHRGNTFNAAISRAEKIREDSTKQGLTGVTYFEQGYPGLLKRVQSPPPAIYYKGNLGVLDRLLAVSGSLKPSRVGEFVAIRIATEMAARKWNVVTGLNPGIERVASMEEIKNGGAACLVLSSGFDRVRTGDNRFIAEVLEKGGLVLTEIPVGLEIEKQQLVLSRRISAGLSSGIFVIEPSQRETSHLIRYGINSKRPILVPRLPEPHRSAPENKMAEDLINIPPQQIYPHIPVLGADPTTVKTLRDSYQAKNRPSIGFPITSRDEYPDIFNRLEKFRTYWNEVLNTPK